MHGHPLRWQGAEPRAHVVAGGADDARFKLEVVDDEADGRKFTSIKVRPCFV